MKVENNHREIAEEIKKECLVVDIETYSDYDIRKDFDNYVRTAKVKWVGFYSYKSGKYYDINTMTTPRHKIMEFINAHKTIVSFNGIEFDIPVLKNNGMMPERYFSHIDCQVVLGTDKFKHKNRGGLMKYKFKSNSLKNIAKAMKLDTMKGDINYSIFKQDEWNEQETKDIKKYLRGDIEVTKQMFDKLFEFWLPFTEFISLQDVKRWSWLTSSSGTLSYKVMCNRAGVKEEYGERGDIKEEMGGLVILPSGPEYRDVWYMDFACLPAGTKIRRQREDKNKPDNKGNKYDVNIEDLKGGDYICGENFTNVKVADVQSKDYNGELYVFELDNGNTVECTPEHKFPIMRARKRIVVEAKDILNTDDFITTLSKCDDFNANYRYGREVRMCDICGTEFEIDIRMKQKTCGDEDCVNMSRSISGKLNGGNVGKNKYNCEYLRRISNERTGVPRKEDHKQNISQGTKDAIKLIPKETKIEWMFKAMKTGKNNLSNGRFVYGGVNFKSNWEIITAQYFDKAGIKWQYEPKGFELSNGKFYFPDFYLPDYDKWVEVKGYMHAVGASKIKKFKEEHNDLYLLNTLDEIKNINKEMFKNGKN